MEYNIKMLDNLQYHSSKKVKRFRSAFTTDQVNYLEKKFKEFPYVGNAHRKEVAHALNIPERAVKIWFQNRRMKEKKESSTKEFGEEQGTRKSLEFAKDPLNNACATSVNEQSGSLPLLTDMAQMNCNKNMITNNLTYNIAMRQSVQDLGIKDSRGNITAINFQNVISAPKVIHRAPVFIKSNHHSPSDYNISTEYSIDLCKKYKGGSFSKTLPVEPTFKKEVINVRSQSPTEHIKPEDLSVSKKSRFPTPVQQGFSNIAPNNPSYASLVPTVSSFYVQPYISTSGVIWKPVNVMPVPPSSSSQISSQNNPLPNMSAANENVMKMHCNCDCHIKPQVPYNVQQQSLSSQYFITAVPFQSSSIKF